MTANVIVSFHYRMLETGFFLCARFWSIIRLSWISVMVIDIRSHQINNFKSSRIIFNIFEVSFIIYVYQRSIEVKANSDDTLTSFAT